MAFSHMKQPVVQGCFEACIKNMMSNHKHRISKLYFPNYLGNEIHIVQSEIEGGAIAVQYRTMLWNRIKHVTYAVAQE